jgi:hypothetical protein
VTDAVLVQVVATGLYVGFQATVRLVVYPQMPGVGAEEFPAYEAAHQRRVTLLVAPLFLALVVAQGLMIVDGALPRAAVLASAALLVALVAVTAFGAVPLHGRLSAGFDAAVHARLLRWDTLRLAIATADLAVAVSLAARS